MGEFADIAIQECEDFESMRFDYRIGLIAPEAAYELGIIDELGYEIGTGANLKTCRCCKTPNLHWENYKGRWLLADDDGIHMCKKVPIKL
jgi:hypothetical protein